MANLVFTTKPEPSYDDLPEVRYHFPKRYLSIAKDGVGDFIVYYEPRRTTAFVERGGGRQRYFAMARLKDVEVDPKKPDHYYAHMSDYLPFDTPVPLRQSGTIYESRLRNQDGSLNMGLIRWAVRRMEPADFESIVSAAFASPPSISEAREQQVEPETVKRPLVFTVVSRPFRDIMFRRLVRRAYDGACAMTGMKCQNGGGALEVEAAHIRPIASPHDGPDSIRNGIALTETMHWLFDHGYVSVDEASNILISSRGFPDKALRLVNEDHRLRLPSDGNQRPHQQFLKYHRERIFKG